MLLWFNGLCFGLLCRLLRCSGWLVDVWDSYVGYCGAVVGLWYSYVGH